MKNLIYKIKNKIYRISNKAQKIKRPSHQELIDYKNFQRGNNNKFALSFGAGRCGQKWFAEIFNSHKNWIGTCERFSDYEAFYRYISYYKLPISKEGIFKILELASNRDMSLHQNTFISSPFLSFGVEELVKRLNPNYLFFHIRDPIKAVESLYRKGWYLNSYNFETIDASIDISVSLHRTLSRITPGSEFIKKWTKLTRIGKVTWFWATINKAIYDDFNKIQNVDKFFIKLEDVDQNYNFYERLSNKFNFENKITKREFYNVINKAPNRGPTDKYEYKDWNNLEKKEFENIIDELFPYYNNIKTNI